MEGVKVCGSLAEFFAKTTNSKQIYRKLNPESTKISNYMIKSSQIKEEVKCSADNKCQWFNASIDERNKSDLQTYVLCIACDRLYHIRCTDCKFSDITEEQLPWMCQVCQSIPMNPAAQSVVFNNKHLISFKDRILEYCKSKQPVATGAVPKKVVDKPQAVQKEIDTSVYEVADDTQVNIDSISHDELLRKFKELQARYTAISNANEHMKRTMYENPTPQLIFSSTGINPSASSTNLPTSRTHVPSSLPIISNRPSSCTNAIIDANYVATRVDEEISRTDPGNSVGNESNAGASECFHESFSVKSHQMESKSNEMDVRSASERDIPTHRSNSHAFVPLMPRKSVLNTHLLPRSQSAFKQFKSYCNYCAFLRAHSIECKVTDIDPSGPFQEMVEMTNASLAFKPVQAFRHSADSKKFSRNETYYNRKAWERDKIFRSYYAKDGNGQCIDIIMPNGSIRKKNAAQKAKRLDSKLDLSSMTI